jgi:hypothetical protein
MRAFKYTERLDDHSIRLLCFTADAENTENIHLVISDHELGSLPTFHALSYTWGPPRKGQAEYTDADKVAIVLNGVEFDVYPNLMHALVQLKKSSLAVFYWIDAICINQGDITERETQVSIMDRIYGSARQVDIWLGMAGSFSNEVLRMIQQMARIAESQVDKFYEIGQGGLLFAFENPEILQRYGLPAITEELWYAFIDFFERKWFKRVWILQEVALAKSAVVLWGDTVLSWKDVTLCSEFLTISNLSRGLAEMQLRKNPTDGHITPIGTTAEGISLIAALCSGRSSELDEEYVTFLNRMAGYGIVQTQVAHYLLLCISVSRPFQSTDKRDKIFALLGIMNKIAEQDLLPKLTLRPDYRRKSSAACAFTTAAYAILSDCQNLGLLTTVTDKSVRSVPELPSWVPDFTSQGPNPIQTLIRSEEMSQFDPSNTREIAMKPFRMDWGILCLHGIQVGTITMLSEPCLDMTNYGHFERCAQLILGCQEIYPATGQSRVEVLWRTILLDMDEFHHPAPDTLQPAFHHWISYLALKGVRLAKESGADPVAYLDGMRYLEQLANSDASGTIPTNEFLTTCAKILGFIPSLDTPFDDDDSDNCTKELMQGLELYHTIAFGTVPYRRLFTTDSGFIGLGPQSIGTGDTLWIISGCASPLVVRKVSKPKNGHELLGEAYVHGIMHGEAVDEQTRWEEIALV